MKKTHKALPRTGEPRLCHGCNKELPDTEKYFASLTLNQCKACDTVRTRELKKYKINVCKKVDDALISNLKRMIDEMPTQAVTTAPTLSEFTRCLAEAYGGAGGLAVIHASQFLMSKPGSANRTRQLADVGKHISKNSELGGAAEALEGMTDEELRKYIEEREKSVLVIEHDGEEASES